MFTFVSENEKFTTLVAAAAGAHTAHAAAATAPAPATAPNTKYCKHFRWGEYIPPDQNPALNARSMVSEVPISHLKILAEQRKSIDAMYHSDSK
jgi:hypothetical protein